MSRKQTIALACILKNEVTNLPRLLASVRGCFDEIHLTDTGSTDGSLELIDSYINGDNPASTPIFLHHFGWINDFAAARNASFAPVKTDYIMWMDLDDVLGDPEKFIQWKDSAMKLADFWLATYQYSLDANGKSLCSFARERVIKNGLGLTWRYFVHEGIIPESPVRPVGIQYAQTWSIKHLRGEEDLKADRNRNLKIFDSHPVRDARMTYYYGKELFENAKPLEGFGELMKAVADEKLQAHDRIMGLQYACMAAMQMNQFEKAIQLAYQGLQLSPQRAEFFVIIGDSYLKLGKLVEAIAYFAAASSCRFEGHNSLQGATFAHEDSYKHYPLNQLARIWANLGDIDKAEDMANKALMWGPNTETMGILKDLAVVKEKVTAIPGKERTKTADIVITCPPQGLYEWDWGVYQKKGIGGSETAACEMAKWMSELTGRKVILFTAPRTETVSFENVEYRPAALAPEYFRDNSPSVHIAWRHCTRFSDDPMYVWCHDLAAPGIEQNKFDKVFALSEFHAGFLQSMHNVLAEKIIVTANGIDPGRFAVLDAAKTPGKVVFSSSPDRGLENALHIMDSVVKTNPDVTLHVYYGFDNMRKMGMGAEADRLTALMAERPYVTFHGNIPQKQLTKEISDACIWLYPTNFLETYCITAIEMLSSHVFPVVRDWGALPDTLGAAVEQGMAKIIDADPQTEREAYANAIRDAFAAKSWEKVNINPSVYSWENVAKSWIEIFGLGEQRASVSI